MRPLIIVVAAAYFMTVQGPHNQSIGINIEEISSIREVHDFEEGHFGNEVNCVIVMSNGKAIGITDVCKSIVRRLFEMHPSDMAKEP